jgi:voltage-gated potassium channel
MSIKGWSLLDSFYMTMITLTTVGFKEIHDLSIAGKIFNIVLVISGVGTVFYTLFGW